LPERFDSRHTEREQILCRKLARFCADSKERLAQCEPTLPPSAFNRLADNWRPLFAIAEIAGGEWPGRAAAAFAKLTAQEDADSQGMGTMLLADIRQTLAEKPATRVFSKSLVDSLCAMTDRPWPEANKGKAITEAWLARRLHSFGIKPRGHRIGDGRARGYEVADFVEPFQRYLSTPGFSNRDTVTNVDPQAVTDFLKRDNGEPCHGFKSTQTIANTELSRCHTSNPRMRGSQES
jgi:hypothetical protein